MIQDIFPSRLNNAYKNAAPGSEDFLFVFDKEGRILHGEKDGVMALPTTGEIRDASGADPSEFKTIYLFSVDEERFFMLFGATHAGDGYTYHSVRELRDLYSGKEVYAAFTAYHLWKWYWDNRFCGKCGDKLKPGEKERSLVCPSCGNTVYPRINPAVIVGVIKGDRILITKYRRGYGHSALVAGFTEIGETLEETVAREVMEETGVRVKNIRYYKSQPWGMAQDILVGFYCEADGDCEIRMDESELKFAEWVRREDIELQPNNHSLTNEMMRRFKESDMGDQFFGKAGL